MSILLKRRKRGGLITMDNLPKFVAMGGGSCLRLTGPQYWRDGGAWGVYYEIKDGKLYSVSDMDHLDNVELNEVSEGEWKDDNVGYVPSSY